MQPTFGPFTYKNCDYNSTGSAEGVMPGGVLHSGVAASSGCPDDSFDRAQSSHMSGNSAHPNHPPQPTWDCGIEGEALAQIGERDVGVFWYWHGALACCTLGDTRRLGVHPMFDPSV